MPRLQFDPNTPSPSREGPVHTPFLNCSTRVARSSSMEPRCASNNTILPGPNFFTVPSIQWIRTGGQSMGDITMADSERWKERRDLVARYRVLEQETTDPLAARLLRDIISELEADLREVAEIDGQGIPTRDCARGPGVIEFYGRTVSCLVRSLSEYGAALDVISPRGIPDRFTLALPLEGATHRCRLIWRREIEIGVTFQRNDLR